MEELKNSIIHRLKHSIQLLASTAETQLGLLPDFVCKGDELVLEYDHWQGVAIGNYAREFNEDQLVALDQIDRKLSFLTDAGAEFWTDDAVRRNGEREEVRSLAKSALLAFGWPLETPPSYGHEYVGSADVQKPQQ